MSTCKIELSAGTETMRNCLKLRRYIGTIVPDYILTFVLQTMDVTFSIVLCSIWQCKVLVSEYSILHTWTHIKVPSPDVESQGTCATAYARCDVVLLEAQALSCLCFMRVELLSQFLCW